MSEEEYERKNHELFDKLEAGVQLTPEEQDFVCTSSKFENLMQFSFCEDYYFTRIFMAKRPEFPQDRNYLRDEDHAYYQKSVSDWEHVVEKTNHSDALLQFTGQETRVELKTLKKEHLSHDSEAYLREKFLVLEWSKYRYIMIKNIFTLKIKSDHYKLYLNGSEIIFNYYSLNHILTRHYAHMMKPYTSKKSHFSHTVSHKEVHLVLENIFKIIDNSTLYTNDSVEEINIRFHSTLYKIFCSMEKIHRNGNEIEYLRLNSFFPIDHEQMLQRLESEFKENVLAEDLSVFTKI